MLSGCVTGVNKYPDACSRYPLEVHMGKLTPVFIPEPRYPQKAQRHGKQGCAVVKFTVTKLGFPENIEMVMESPEGFGFGKSAVRATPYMKYYPGLSNDLPVETDDVAYLFSYRIAGY